MGPQSPDSARAHRRAILMMIVAAICWSSGGILVRQLSITNAWEIVFWRSVFMALFVTGVLVVMHGRRMPQAVVAAGAPGLVSGLFLAGTFCFAAQVTVLRRFHATVDMLPQVLIAGVVSLVIALALSPPFAATTRDLAFLALMGCVQLGTGCLLATAASRHLSATELGLLALLEPIAGPLWVWVLMGENPGTATLTGGAIVLAAVCANEAFAAWRESRGAGAAGVAADGRLP